MGFDVISWYYWKHVWGNYYGIRAWLDLSNQTTSYKSSLPFDGFSWQVGLHKVPCIFFLNFYFAIENLLLVMPKYLEMACVLLDHTFFGYNTYELICLPPTPLPSKMKTCHRQLLAPPHPETPNETCHRQLVIHYFWLGCPLPHQNCQCGLGLQILVRLFTPPPNTLINFTNFNHFPEYTWNCSSQTFFYYCSHKYILHSVYIRNIYYTLTEKWYLSSSYS